MGSQPGVTPGAGESGTTEASLWVSAIACASDQAWVSGERAASLSAVPNRGPDGSAAKEEAAGARAGGVACDPVESGMGAGLRCGCAGDRPRYSCFNCGGCLYTGKPFLRSGHEFVEPSSDASVGSGDRTSGNAGGDSVR